MRSDEWWPLSAALAWIARRKPLAFWEWDEDVMPPRPASQCVMPNAWVPQYVAETLAAGDDGISEGLAALARQLFDAAAAGEIEVRGRDAAKRDAELVAISRGYFTRKALVAFPADEILGRHDSTETEELRMGGGTEVQEDFPWWRDVRVSAQAARTLWPYAPPQPAEWMAANVTGSPKWKRDAAVTECRKATGCTTREAQKAWMALPASCRRVRGRPKA